MSVVQHVISGTMKLLKPLYIGKHCILEVMTVCFLTYLRCPSTTAAYASMQSITNNRGFKPCASEKLTRKYFLKKSCDITGGSEDNSILFLTI